MKHFINAHRISMLRTTETNQSGVITAFSKQVDTKGETDKGACDAVSGTTADHGLYHGSFL